MIKNLFLILILLIALSNCKKDSPETSSIGTPSDYYPLKVGSYHIYLVDSIYHNDVTKKAETYQFQIKEVLTDTFYDQSNRLNYRLEKYYRYQNDSTTFDQATWQFSRVWFVTSTINSIERVEENVRFINLTNPIKNGISWNGNAFNFKESWSCVYENFEKPYLTYTNTVKVLQQDNENLIEKQYYEQYFAKGIGIVRYHYIDIESQNVSSNLPIMERIEKGVQYTQELVSYYIPE